MPNDNKYIRSAGTPTSIEDGNLSADEPVGKINSELSDNRSTSNSDNDSSSSSSSDSDTDDNCNEDEISNPSVPNSSSTCSSSSSSVTRPCQQAAPVGNPSHDAEEHVRNSRRNDWMEKIANDHE